MTAGQSKVMDHGELSVRRRTELVWVAVIMVGLAVIWTARAWAHPTSDVVGSYGTDRYLFLWFLRWTAFALAHGHDPFVTKFAIYPSGANLMWNTAVPLAGLVLSPITWIAGPVLSYNVLLTLGPALSGWCAYVAFRRWANPMPALTGSLLFGFGPFVVNGMAYEHPNLVLVASAPLLLLLFDRVASGEVRSNLRLGIALGVLLAAQLLLSEEILAIEIVALATGAIVVAVVGRAHLRTRMPAALRVVGVGGLVFLLLDAWPLWVQFFGPNRASAPIHKVAAFDADPLGYVLPFAGRWPLHDQLFQFLHGNGDGVTSFGLPLFVLLIVAMITLRHRPVVKILATVMACIAVFSLGPVLVLAGHISRIAMPWRLVSNLPVLRDLLPVRFTVVLDLLAGLLLALFLQWLGSRDRRTRAMVWGVTVLTLIVVVHTPFPQAPISTPVAFVQQRMCPSVSQKPPVVVVLPFVSEPAMGWQEEAGFCFRMPGGYLVSGSTTRDSSGDLVQSFGPQPLPVVGVASQQAAHGLALPVVTPHIRRQIHTELDHSGITTVVLGPSAGQAVLGRWLTSVFGSPRKIGSTEIWTTP
jgi:hypothetical protein